MLQKVCSHEIKDLDDKTGYVEAYANVYNNEDSDKDISHPTSFIKTVSENFKKIRVYKNHDRTILVGVPVKLEASNAIGLLTGTKFQMETNAGRDMYHDVKLIHSNNQDADLSIGYDIMARDKKDRRWVMEYKLKEYSFLTSWGANPLAIVANVKGEDSPAAIIEMLSKMYNQPYSDPRLRQIESLLKTLTVAPEQINATTLTDEPSKGKTWAEFIQNKQSN